LNAEGEALRSDSDSGRRTSETVAGFLSAIAIFISFVGLAWHPLRLIVPSLAIALIASGMGSGKGRLQFAAVLICTVCLFFGLTIAVVASKPLW
jgi:phosphoglycerol transferase MdoB-like AlkP superfamily enzyme